MGLMMRPLLLGRSAEAMDAIPETRASVIVENFMFDIRIYSFKRIDVGGGLLCCVDRYENCEPIT